MQEMIDPQELRRAGFVDRVGEDRSLAVDLLDSLLAPDPQRIEHGGDPADRQLAVIGDDRRDRIPIDLRARHVMSLDMVGVQLDQAGHQEIAAKIEPAFRGAAFAERDDCPVHSDEPAGFDHLLGENEPGVRKDELRAIRRHGRSWATPQRGRARRLVAAKWELRIVANIGEWLLMHVSYP